MTITRTNTSVLRMYGRASTTPYSARGLSQTIEPIDEAVGHLERSINGELIDFGYEPFQKYKSTITGNDQQPPALDSVWPGEEVVVECITELAAHEYALLGRTAVDGSMREDLHGFTYYRPKLTMLVQNFSIDRDEYGAQVGWKLDLLEK